jgi:hypothetical protein
MHSMSASYGGGLRSPELPRAVARGLPLRASLPAIGGELAPSFARGAQAHRLKHSFPLRGASPEPPSYAWGRSPPSSISTKHLLGAPYPLRTY